MLSVWARWSVDSLTGVCAHWERWPGERGACGDGNACESDPEGLTFREILSFSDVKVTLII
jgi:hypothetical protein